MKMLKGGKMPPRKMSGDQVSSIQITPERLAGYYDALQTCMRTTFPSGVAYVIAKNWKWAAFTMDQVMKDRRDLLKQFAEMDENGKFVTEKHPNTPESVVYKDVAAKLEHTRQDNELQQRKLYKLSVIEMEMSDMGDLETPIQPGLLIALEPMLIDNVTKDEVLPVKDGKDEPTDSVQPAEVAVQ